MYLIVALFFRLAEWHDIDQHLNETNTYEIRVRHRVATDLQFLETILLGQPL